MFKDLDLATFSAQSVGVSLPLSGLVQQMYRSANNSGYSEQDYTAIAAFLLKINGMGLDSFKLPKTDGLYLTCLFLQEVLANSTNCAIASLIIFRRLVKSGVYTAHVDISASISQVLRRCVES